jgi:hypothetical protein
MTVILYYRKIQPTFTQKPIIHMLALFKINKCLTFISPDNCGVPSA